MIKIQFVLPNTEAKFSLTGSPISAAAVNTLWNEEHAESIAVVCGAVGYSCEDGSCVVVTPAGPTALTNLWPTTAAEPVAIAAEPVAIAAEPEAPVA